MDSFCVLIQILFLQIEVVWNTFILKNGIYLPEVHDSMLHINSIKANECQCLYESSEKIVFEVIIISIKKTHFSHTTLSYSYKIFEVYFKCKL